MAFDAKPHVKMFSFDAIVGFHRPVAFLAENLFADVALVVKEHMFSQVIGLAPGCRRLRIEIFMLLLYPGMIGNDVFVTVEAFFHRRYSRVARVTHVGMAVLTLDVFYPGMNAMAEWNRLRDPDIGARCCIEKVQKQDHQSQTAEAQQEGADVSPQRLQAASEEDK
jgi:hypothetical protein